MPVVTNNAINSSVETTTQYAYDAEVEIEKRAENLKSWCELNHMARGMTRAPPFRMGWVSRHGGLNYT